MTPPTPEAKVTPRPVVSSTAKPKPKPAAKSSPGSPYAEIDAHALAAPPNVEASIDKLAAYLVRPARNDREKIRAIHRWVADRIAYDTVSFNSGNIPDQSAERTLKSRLSVCAGYANLVHALAESAGVTTEVISGHARDLDDGEQDLEKHRHAWNAVQLDGLWYLMDTTWSAGNIGDDQAFHKEYDDFYFLTKPADFRNRHFPEDEKWQLVEPALNWQQFHRQPLLDESFYSSGLLLSPNTGVELKAAPVASLSMDVPGDLLLMARLEDATGVEREGAVAISRQGSKAIVSVKAPAAGEYHLSLFSGKSVEGRFEGVAQFKVVASRGDSDGYPEMSPILQQRAGRLTTPSQGVVGAGRQRFDLRIRGARKVFINDWDQELQRDGDRFTGELDLAVGEARVFAQFDDSSAEQVATYRVR